MKEIKKLIRAWANEGTPYKKFSVLKSEITFMDRLRFLFCKDPCLDVEVLTGADKWSDENAVVRHVLVPFSKILGHYYESALPAYLDEN